jgi:hypothetical protein
VFLAEDIQDTAEFDFDEGGDEGHQEKRHSNAQDKGYTNSKDDDSYDALEKASNSQFKAHQEMVVNILETVLCGAIIVPVSLHDLQTVQ